MTPDFQSLSWTAFDPQRQIADIGDASRTQTDDPLALLGMLDGISAYMAFLARQNTHLEGALETNRRIGAALGILMTRHRITDDAAFLMLRDASQRCHRKLRDIADDVMYAGEMPADPARASTPAPSAVTGP